MALPLFDEIRAKRAEHALATVAHNDVHAINELISELERWTDEWARDYALPGLDALDGFEQKWASTFDAVELPPATDPLTLEVHRARLKHASELLMPLATRHHHLEHELEHMLKEQYDQLMADDAHAAVKAVLVPLYQERQELFDQLYPAWNDFGLYRSGVEQLERQMQQASESAATHAQDDHRHIQAQITFSHVQTAIDVLTKTLGEFGLEGPYPARSELDSWNVEQPEQFKAEAERLLAEMLEYLQRVQAIAAERKIEVEAMYARWQDIEAAIHEHTG